MTGSRRLFWFGVIGGGSTLLYAGLAWLLTVPLGWWPPLASAVAFTACAVGSFTGWRPAMPVTQWAITKQTGDGQP